MTRRYKVDIPEALYEELSRVAVEKDLTVDDLIRQFFRVGLLIAYTEDKADVDVLIREGDSERVLKLKE